MDLSEKKQMLQIIQRHWKAMLASGDAGIGQRRANREIVWQNIYEEAVELGHRWTQDPEHNAKWLCRKFASWKDDFKQKRKRHFRNSGGIEKEKLSEMDLIIIDIMGDDLLNDDDNASLTAPGDDSAANLNGTGIVMRDRISVKKEELIDVGMPLPPQKKRKYITSKMQIMMNRRLEELDIRRKEQELRLGELQIQKEEMSIWQMHLQIYKLENELGVAHRYIDINVHPTAHANVLNV